MYLDDGKADGRVDVFVVLVASYILLVGQEALGKVTTEAVAASPIPPPRPDTLTVRKRLTLKLHHGNPGPT